MESDDIASDVRSSGQDGADNSSESIKVSLTYSSGSTSSEYLTINDKPYCKHERKPCDQSSINSNRDPLLNLTNNSDIESSIDKSRGGLDTDGSFDQYYLKPAAAKGHISDGAASRTGSELSISGTHSSNRSSKGSDKKRNSTSWYNALNPTYKSRSEEYHRIFISIPPEERLIVDYSCAFQKDILVHGRLYITQNWICFYANIFRWETIIEIKCEEITNITKEKTAYVIPNALAITTLSGEKYHLTSLISREKTFLMLFKVWQNALISAPVSPQMIWEWVHQSYGDELGLTSSDDDYIGPTDEEMDPSNKPFHEHPDNSGEIYKGSIDDISNCYNEIDDSSLSLNSTFNSPKPSDHCTLLDHHPIDGQISCDENNEQTNLPSVDEYHAYDQITDLGDTSEDSAEVNDKMPDSELSNFYIANNKTGEVLCSGHEHNGFTALDEVFQIPVDQMFELLFTDSDFNRDFLKARKSYDIVQPPWPDVIENNDKVRTVTYTLALNYSVGPKSTATTIKQTCFGQSKPGVIYVVDTETTTADVPYADSFYVFTRYCITRSSQRKCRLHVNFEIKYIKSVWALVKGFIEKNASQGLVDNFQLLAEHLRIEQDKRDAVSTGHASRKKILRRRKGQIVSTGRPQPFKRVESVKKSIKPADVSHNIKILPIDDNMPSLRSDIFKKVIFLILFVLVIFNMMLFYKCWSLDQYSSLLFYSQSDFRKLPVKSGTYDEWSQLLHQQKQLYDHEIGKWKTLIGSAVDLLDQMKIILKELLGSLNHKKSEL